MYHVTSAAAKKKLNYLKSYDRFEINDSNSIGVNDTPMIYMLFRKKHCE